MHTHDPAAMRLDRRSWLQRTSALATLLSLGLVTAQQARAAGRAGFDAETLEAALKAVGGQPVAHAQLGITAPDIAENGAKVDVTVVSRLPNTTEIYLLVEKNPHPLAAMFTLLQGTEPELQTRLKMQESSKVLAVVRADGKLYSAAKDVRVTVGGCGN